MGTICSLGNSPTGSHPSDGLARVLPFWQTGPCVAGFFSYPSDGLAFGLPFWRTGLCVTLLTDWLVWYPSDGLAWVLPFWRTGLCVTLLTDWLLGYSSDGLAFGLPFWRTGPGLTLLTAMWRRNGLSELFFNHSCWFGADAAMLFWGKSPHKYMIFVHNVSPF